MGKYKNFNEVDKTDVLYCLDKKQNIAYKLNIIAVKEVDKNVSAKKKVVISFKNDTYNIANILIFNAEDSNCIIDSGICFFTTKEEMLIYIDKIIDKYKNIKARI